MKTILFVVVLAMIAAAGLLADRDIDRIGTEFTVVTLNASWLFDGVGEESFSTAPQTPEEAEAHLDAVAAYLASVDPDYINLEEVEDEAMLARLNAKLGGGYAPVFVQGTDDYTGQDVAALSRYPVVDAGRSDAEVRYPVAGSQFTRPMGRQDVAKHYWATVDVDGREITFIGVHFLAYPDDIERAVRREAEASIIRTVAADALIRGNDVIVLGDFNDFDTDVCDAAGNRPISCVDRLLKDVDPASPGDELVNVASGIPAAERYTYWYDVDHDGIDDGDAEHSQIDHIYASRDLASDLVSATIDHSYPAGSVSDHWPVLATFALP